MEKLKNYIRNSSKTAKIVFGLLLVAFVGFIDYYTTREVSFSIFYLIPITFTAWYVGKYAGVFFSILSAIVWFNLDNISNLQYSSPAIPFWNALVRLGFFVIVVFLIHKIKSLKTGLENSIVQRTSELITEINEHKKSREEIFLMTNQLRELNRKIESIKEDQNARIAREIHDELGQSLTAINLELNWISKKNSRNADVVQRLGALSKIVIDTIGTVRKISSDLRPRLLDQLGIFPAIESQLKEFESRTSIKTSLSLPGKTVEIDNNAATTIFRILQEALTNIARHSKCKNVDVLISANGSNTLMMSVKDDGIGFDSEKAAKGLKSLGIIGMKERASILNGTLDVVTSQGQGTEIILKAPI